MLRKMLQHYQHGTLLEAAQRTAIKWMRLLGRKEPPIGDIYYGRKADRYVEKRENTPLYDAEYDAVRKLLQHVPDAMTVLDVPFGTGRFVPLHIEKGMTVSGLDASSDMVAAASKVLGKKFDKCNVDIGDATRMPYADKSFHLLVCIRFLGSIISFGQAKEALREFARVTENQAIISFNERREGAYRWRSPRDSERMGGRLYAHEIEDLLSQVGFGVAKKEGPLFQNRRRAVYVYLCEKIQK